MGNFESHEGSFTPSRSPWSAASLDLSRLLVDQAYVGFVNNVTKGPTVLTYTLTEECDACLPKALVPVGAERAKWVAVDTKYAFNIYAGENGSTLCRGAEYGEFGVYACLLHGTERELRCDCFEDLEAAHIGWPMLCCLAVYLALVALCFLARFAQRSWREKRRTHRAGSLFLNGLFGSPVRAERGSGNEEGRQEGRIRSVDTFRGLALVVAMFVNYGHGEYRYFARGPWNGVYLGDLPFPWMLWLMGLCVPTHLRGRLRLHDGSKARVARHVLRRSLVIFLVGLFLGSDGESDPDLSTLRVLGPLQRFAIVYLLLASLHLVSVGKGPFVAPGPGVKIARRPMSDVLGMWVEWTVALVVVFVYLLVLFLLPVPGCPRGYLGPGGRHEASRYSNCTGGATMYVDRKILGERHTAANPSYAYIYDTTVRFDPEGVLSTLPAFLASVLGMQAGMTMVCFQSWKQRVARWAAWCAATGAITAALCQASKNDGWIPINRNLWSLSFVTFSCCCAFFALTAFYLLVEASSSYDGAPLHYLGANALVVYAGHALTKHVFPWSWTNGDRRARCETHGYRLAADLWAVTLCALIATLASRS